jgi:transposase InsO family protein
MKKGSSKSKQNPEPQTPRRRKYDEEFKRQAVAMVGNGQPVRSAAQALGISENVLHRWKREASDSQSNSELEVENLRQRLKYLPLQDEDWAYLATWMDLFSRMIIGWQIADSMTAELVIEAIRKAILRERLPTGMIVHSDRGGQYVDTEFRGLLNQRGFEQSMSRADETYDNAHAESLFSRYKAELLEGGAFADLEQARSETFA